MGSSCVRQNNEKNSVKSIEIFCGSCPYDKLRQIKCRQKDVQVISLDHDELHTIWLDMKNGRKNFKCDSTERVLYDAIHDETLSRKTAFSIECCQAVLKLSDNVLQSIREITIEFLKAGCNVAIADFALDIVNKIFQEIIPTPFERVRSDVQGKIQLKFSPKTLVDAPNGQISVLGSLATEGTSTINTMTSTRRPVLNHMNDSQIIWKVLAVANGAGSPDKNELIYVNALNGEWSNKPKENFDLIGTPAIMILNNQTRVYSDLGWKGNILLFAAHFSDLERADGVTEDALIDVAQQRYDSATAAKCISDLRNATQENREAVMDEWMYMLVNHAPQSRSTEE